MNQIVHAQRFVSIGSLYTIYYMRMIDVELDVPRWAQQTPRYPPSDHTTYQLQLKFDNILESRRISARTAKSLRDRVQHMHVPGALQCILLLRDVTFDETMKKWGNLQTIVDVSIGQQWGCQMSTIVMGRDFITRVYCNAASVGDRVSWCGLRLLSMGSMAIWRVSDTDTLSYSNKYHPIHMVWPSVYDVAPRR